MARSSRLALTVTAALALASFAVIAMAAHWSHSGANAGRSGYQPIDEVGPPVLRHYTQSDASPIRTSILTSTGSLAQQRTIYATTDGRMHHRGLDDGEPSFSTRFVLSPDFTPDADILGSGVGHVSPVESSTPNGLGFTFQVFNENAPDTDPTAPSDIALSIFRQTDGSLVDTVRIPGGTNYTVNQSPLLFESALWFVATPDSNPQIPPQAPDATAKLFKVNIGDPSGSAGGNPTVGSTKTINVSGATSTAPTTGLYLKDAEGNPKPYVSVSFSSGNSVQTFSADTVDPVAGPRSGDLPGSTAYTVSVPSLADGSIPGPGRAVTTAPYLYLPVQSTDPVSDYPGTQVLKLVQSPDSVNSLVLAPGESNISPAVIGNSGNMLAVSQFANEPAPDSPGHVVMSNACDVYSISVANMADVEPLLGPNASSDCATTSTTLNPASGFRQTTAALSGNLGFIQRNNGDQIAFTIDRADILPPSQFEEVDPQDAASAFGQPAIARRLIQFGDDKRLSVYRAAAFLPPGNSGAQFSVNDVSVNEGNSGAQQATFTITRQGVLGGSVTVTTADNTAKAGEDYTSTTTELAFTRGETSKTFTVPLLADTGDEPDETFFVRLSDAEGAGAELLDAEGLGLISDDDPTPAPAPILGVSDVSVLEGSVATFNVSLSSAAAHEVTLDFGTADDTAKAPGDYTPTRGSLRFAPGETIKAVSVPVLKDRADDPNERFFLGVVNVKGATAPDPVGSALVADVQPDRLRARRFTASTSPKRDRSAPFRFVTSGRLVPPAGLTRAEACTGRVSVQVKVIRKTISNRRTTLRSNCRFRTTVSFKNRKRFSKSGRLSFNVRFLGNAEVLRSATRRQTVRTK